MEPMKKSAWRPDASEIATCCFCYENFLRLLSSQNGSLTTFFDTSTISDGEITDWHWDFGDGGTSNAQNQIHTFDTIGTYTVTLTVTGTYGVTDSVSVPVIVDVPPLTIGGGVSGYEVINNLIFTASSDPYYVYTEWDMGDGTVIENVDDHVYAYALIPGDPPPLSIDYDVRFTAYGPNYPENPNDIWEGTRSVQILSLPEPIPHFHYIPIEEIRYTFRFDGTRTLSEPNNKGIDPDSFVWDFGHRPPQGTGTGVINTHTFPGINPSGSYFVTLTVSNPRYTSTSAPVEVPLRQVVPRREYECTIPLIWTVVGIPDDNVQQFLDLLGEIIGSGFILPNHKAKLVLDMEPSGTPGGDQWHFPEEYEILYSYTEGSNLYWSLDTETQGGYYQVNETGTSFYASSDLTWHITLSLSASVTATFSVSEITDMVQLGFEVQSGVEFELGFSGISECKGEYKDRWFERQISDRPTEESAAFGQDVDQGIWRESQLLPEPIS